MNAIPAGDSSSKRRRVASAIAALILLLIAFFLLKRLRVSEERREAESRASSMETPGPASRPKPGPELAAEAGTPASENHAPDPLPASKTRGTITGRITDVATGAPIAAAEVFGAPVGATEFPAGPVGFVARTDADGRYSVEVDAGSWQLNVRAKGEFVLTGLAVDDVLSVEIAVARDGYRLMRQIIGSTDLVEVTLSPGEGPDPSSEEDYGEWSGPEDEK